MQTRPVTPLLQAPFCWFPPVACSQMYGHHLVPFLYKEYHDSHEGPSPESQQPDQPHHNHTYYFHRPEQQMKIKFMKYLTAYYDDDVTNIYCIELICETICNYVIHFQMANAQ